MKTLPLTGIIVALVIANACSSKPSPSFGSTSSAIERLDDQGGAQGVNDEDSDEGSRFYAQRSRRGLAITPVKLDLTGQTRRQIQKIGYGSYMVNAVADCDGCHTSPAGFLAGGIRFDIGPGNYVFSRNLTPDETGLHLTEDEFIESLRTGKDFSPDYQDASLIVMPWPYFRWMTRGDLSAIYAYLKVIPPLENRVDADVKPKIPPAPSPISYDEGDVIRSLPRDTDRARPNVERGLAIQPLAQPDLSHHHGVRERFGRGSYLVNAVAACSGCHTNPDRDRVTLQINTEAYLSGGGMFLPPPPLQVALHEARAASANLSGMTLGFFHEEGSTFERFKDVIRSGTHADENPPRPLAWPMPWPRFRDMLDEDLFAVYTYTSRVPVRTGKADKEIPNYARWCANDSDCRAGETCYTNPATGDINECVGGPCAMDNDCDVCQTCNDGVCAAPDVGSTCIADGI
jgi:hypothetical protein